MFYRLSPCEDSFWCDAVYAISLVLTFRIVKVTVECSYRVGFKN